MKNFKYTINGTVYNVVVNSIEDAIANIEVNGAPYKVEMEKQEKKQQVVVNPTRPATVPVTPIARPVAVVPSGPKALRSPLPGTIIEVSCKVGDSVKKGQKLMVLEAMKMENSINSDKDGVVKEIKVNQGDAVLEGNDLVIIE